MEKTVENSVDIPEETCNMEPVEECRNVTIRYSIMVADTEV